MKLYVDPTEEPTSDDLPNQTEDKMFTTFGEIRRSDVDDRASDGLGRCDHDVVVLCDLKCVQGLPSSRLVENTRVDGIGDGIVDKFTKD